LIIGASGPRPPIAPQFAANRRLGPFQLVVLFHATSSRNEIWHLRLSAALDKQVKIGIFGFAEVVADATDFDTVNQFFLA
jgi:hypothetical protein